MTPEAFPLGLVNPNGNFTQSTRDSDGRVTQSRDKNGNVTLANYDASGQLIQQQVPVQAPGQPVSYATTQYAYDQAGNRTQVLTPLAIQNGSSLFSSPPSACTTTPTTSPCPFTWVTTYNPDNQVATQQTPQPGATANTPRRRSRPTATTTTAGRAR